MKIYGSAAQIQGTREEQQDSWGLYPPLSSGERWIAAIADGMGGLPCGALASRAAIDAVSQDQPKRISAAELLISSVRRANGDVWGLSVAQGYPGYVGTTLVITALEDGYLHWVSVGDSRLYICRGGILTQLTEDHTVWRRLKRAVASGHIDYDDAASNPEKDALTSFIGIDELTEICRSEEPFYVQDGDIILLLTDGVFNTLTEDEIAAALEASEDPAHALIGAVSAKNTHYQDNATAVILYCAGE